MMQTFGKRLAAARNAKGLTQEELARALDVARNTISSWERDRTLPDVEMLRRISAVLNCDLMAPDSPAQEEPAVATDAAGPVSEPEAAPQPEGTSAPAPASRRKKLAWIIAAVAVLCACAVAGWLHFRAPASDGDPFSVEYYQQETPNVPGQAWFVFDNQSWIASGENMSFQHCLIKMEEQNGVAFNVTRLEVKVQSAKSNRVTRVFNMGVSDMQVNMVETDIPPYGTFSIEGGFPMGEFRRVGIAVFGNDANGTPLAFYSLIEY
ncbi:MAG: helix-turn-helix transcriptional regulator [Clostridia bacterium]|nr:helix-turn-helix transcriptional regulator [Clostridia bacterium]